MFRCLLEGDTVVRAGYTLGFATHFQYHILCDNTAVMLLYITDEESFLRETSSIHVREEGAIFLTGTNEERNDQRLDASSCSTQPHLCHRFHHHPTWRNCCLLMSICLSSVITKLRREVALMQNRVHIITKFATPSPQWLQSHCHSTHD